MSESPVAEQQPEQLDPGLTKLLAEMRRDKLAMQLLDTKDQQEQQQAVDARRGEQLSRWTALPGFENLPLPTSPEELRMLPPGAVAMLRSSDPQLYAELGGQLMPLPAGVEGRLRQGIEHLRDSDYDALVAAGRTDVIQQVQALNLQARLEAFEQGQRQAMEAAAAQQLAWEQARQQGEAQANAAARSQWLGSVMSGAPNPLVGVAQHLGAIRPGPR